MLNSGKYEEQGLYAVKFDTENDLEVGGRYIILHHRHRLIPHRIICVQGAALDDLDRLGVKYKFVEVPGLSDQQIAKRFS